MRCAPAVVSCREHRTSFPSTLILIKMRRGEGSHCTDIVYLIPQKLIYHPWCTLKASSLSINKKNCPSLTHTIFSGHPIQRYTFGMFSSTLDVTQLYVNTMRNAPISAQQGGLEILGHITRKIRADLGSRRLQR